PPRGHRRIDDGLKRVRVPCERNEGMKAILRRVPDRPRAASMSQPRFPHRHLLGIEGLSPDDIRFLLDEAEQWIAFNRGVRKQDHRLDGLTQINAFFENSTRTLFSFEIAGKRLGAQVANFHAASSSVK